MRLTDPVERQHMAAHFWLIKAHLCAYPHVRRFMRLARISTYHPTK